MRAGGPSTGGRRTASPPANAWSGGAGARPGMGGCQSRSGRQSREMRSHVSASMIKTHGVCVRSRCVAGAGDGEGHTRRTKGCIRKERGRGERSGKGGGGAGGGRGQTGKEGTPCGRCPARYRGSKACARSISARRSRHARNVVGTRGLLSCRGRVWFPRCGGGQHERGASGG